MCIWMFLDTTVFFIPIGSNEEPLHSIGAKNMFIYHYLPATTTTSKTTVIRQHSKLERALELESKVLICSLNTSGTRDMTVVK